MQKTDLNLLRIYAVLPHTSTLGPFLRFAVWVQGCNRECPWCMTPDARPCDQGTMTDTDSLAKQIIADSHIEGMTISGGEWCGNWYGNRSDNPPEKNPKGPGTGSFRVRRGGGWFNEAGYCRSAYRLRDSPVERNYILGLRLALSPGQQQ